MYMAPIRKPARPWETRRRGSSLRFPFGLSVLFAALAGIGFALLDSQAPATFQIRATLKVASPVQVAVSRPGDDRAGGAHALWVGSNLDAKDGADLAPPSKEHLAQSARINRIAPSSGDPDASSRAATDRSDRALKDSASKADPNPASKGKVAMAPTKRPDRSLALRHVPRNAVVHHHRRLPGTTAGVIGPYRVQVGAFRTPEAARTQWVSLRRQHADIFASYVMIIEKVHRGRGGIIYRLQAGPVRSRSAVARLCSRLSKRRIGCSLVDG